MYKKTQDILFCLYVLKLSARNVRQIVSWQFLDVGWCLVMHLLELKETKNHNNEIPKVTVSLITFSQTSDSCETQQGGTLP